MSHQGYQPLSTKDVVFVEALANSASLFQADSTLRVKDLLTKIEAICAASGQLSAEEVSILFGTGLNCELLRPGATDWQQGRLQLNLAFQSGSPTGPPATPITIHRPQTIDRPIAAPVIALPQPVAPPQAIAPPTAAVNRAALVTPIVANDPPELDLASFSNATEHEFDQDELDIDHSDVFSLMDDNEAAVPLEEDFSFGEVLKSLSGLEFDVEPPSKSISSPWDLEELDGMLMVK